MTINLGDRIWDIPLDLKTKEIKEGLSYFNVVKRYRFKEGVLVFFDDPSRPYISTKILELGPSVISLDIEPITPREWQDNWAPYILEDLEPEMLIDLTGEFDVDDIELAEIFMEEM